eukprot:1603387-Pyramimonas_sp.AAC.1
MGCMMVLAPPCITSAGCGCGRTERCSVSRASSVTTQSRKSWIAFRKARRWARRAISPPRPCG